MLKYIPHGNCYLWNPSLVSLHVISDVLITIAYYSIPLMLIYFIKQRRDLPFPSIFWLFSLFIIACGTTHAMEVLTLWYPTYWLSGMIKAITAIVSVFTASELIPLIPLALALPSPAQLEIANQQLKEQIAERQQIETQLRDSEERYRGVVEDQTECIARFQPDGTILFVNDAYCRYFGKTKKEIIGNIYQPIIFPDDLEKIDRLLESLTPEHPVGKVEHRVIVGEEVRWMQWVNRAIYNIQGELIEFQSVGRDISDRVAIEEKLKKSEARFRAASEGGLDSFFIFEPLRDETGNIIDFIFVEMNSHAEQFLSMSKQELIGKRLCEIFPVNRTRGFFEKYIQVLETGTVLAEEFPIDNFLPNVSWLYHIVVPLADGIAINTRNITKRKQAEQTLQEREKLLAAIFNQTNHFIWLLNGHGILLKANETALGVCEVRASDVKGLPFWQTPWWKNSAITQQKLQNGVSISVAGGLVRQEIDLQTMTGEVKIIDFTLKPIQDESGRVNLLIAEATDISDRKQMEIALQEREERFRQAFDNAPIGIAMVSPQGNFIRVNHALSQMLGYSEVELMQLTFQQITYPDDLATDLALVQELLEGKISFYEMEKRYIHQQGYMIWAILSVSLVRGFSGKPLYFISQIQNITNRKQYEIHQQNFITRLERSNQELQDFAYVASHDLQEPLRKIQTFGDRLKTKYAQELDEKGRDYLERMQNAAYRMQNLIRDLLNLSRVTTKAQPFLSVELSQIVQEVVGDLEARIEQTKGQVEVGDLPTIEADPLQMRQLLQNLISNGLKFQLPEKPPIVKIEGKLLPKTGEVELLVSDNGIGFDEQYLDRIFVPFQRLHGKQQYEGTGMGLAICRKIVERHCGNITARSTPNRGTTFVITMPMKQILQQE